MTDFSKKIWTLYKWLGVIISLFLFLIVSTIALHINPDFFHRKNQNNSLAGSNSVIESEFKEGVHISTGFRQGEGVGVVIVTCTACHSAKMVTQNRATREGWESMIRWMQQTQNLWDLGENEKIILDYLEKYYSPENVGRRKNLEDTQWYVLQ